MKTRIAALCVALVVAGVGVSTSVQAGPLYTATLTFDNPGGYVYGERYSLQSLVSYEHVAWSGGVLSDWGSAGDPVSRFEVNLSWGDKEFGDLQGVLWADSPGDIASISVRTTNPEKYLVRIESFKLAAFENASPPDPGYLVKMYANDFESVAFFEKVPPPFIDRSSHILIEPTYGDLPGAEGGYRQISLQWQDPWDIAIDDVTFSVWAVPEPTTLALYGLGLAGLGLVAYRRRKAL